MKVSLNLKIAVATLGVCLSGTMYAQEKEARLTTKILGTSARVLFAELSRHERIESHEGMQSVQASGVVCVAADVTAKTNYGCLVGEDGRTPQIPSRSELF